MSSQGTGTFPFFRWQKAVPFERRSPLARAGFRCDPRLAEITAIDPHIQTRLDSQYTTFARHTRLNIPPSATSSAGGRDSAVGLASQTEMPMAESRLDPSLHELAVRIAAEKGSHPNVDVQTSYALDRASLTKSQIAEMENHLKLCASCRRAQQRFEENIEYHRNTLGFEGGA